MQYYNDIRPDCDILIQYAAPWVGGFDFGKVERLSKFATAQSVEVRVYLRTPGSGQGRSGAGCGALRLSSAV